MKDWSDLEERYQDMKSVDPKGAESFKKKMTAVSVVNYLIYFINILCQRFFFLIIFLLSEIPENGIGFRRGGRC